MAKTDTNIVIIRGKIRPNIRKSKDGRAIYFDVAVARNNSQYEAYLPVRVFSEDESKIKEGLDVQVEGRFESGSYTGKDGSWVNYSYIVPTRTPWYGLGGESKNWIYLNGHLTKDPELHTTQTGKMVCSVRIACNLSRKQGDEFKDYPSYIDVIFWDEAAQEMSHNAKKGSYIEVEGALNVRSYTDKAGQKRIAYTVSASKAKPLTFTNQSSTNAGSTQVTAPNAIPSAQTTYGGYDSDDFSSVDDGDDLPF